MTRTTIAIVGATGTEIVTTILNETTVEDIVDLQDDMMIMGAAEVAEDIVINSYRVC